jgi:microcystin-dependent protein
MAEPFLSEMRIMSFTFAPKGWALCNGQPSLMSQTPSNRAAP